MNLALDQIFNDVQGTAERNLGMARAGVLSNAVKTSGEIRFDFTLDQSGNASFEASKYGLGFTVYCEAFIIDPNDTYSIDVKVSDGGGGHWDNVKVNQELKFDVCTSVWHETKVTVRLHAANSKGKAGRGILKYKF